MKPHLDTKCVEAVICLPFIAHDLQAACTHSCYVNGLLRSSMSRAWHASPRWFFSTLARTRYGTLL